MLLKPFSIVAHDAEHKSVIADAGTVVALLNQRTLYREWTSPITHNADEVLVRYGNAGKETIGWLPAQVYAPKSMKAMEGPTFLVTTSKEESASAWDQWRIKIARARKHGHWFGSWLAANGEKYPQELREVTRIFGGKTVRNEGFDIRWTRLIHLVLHTELDMATAKKSAKKAAKKGAKKVAKITKSAKSAKKSKGKEEKVVKAKARKTAAPKKAKKAKASSGDRITRKQDSYVIRRLVKENPRRAGSERAKVWARLKKGMTVETFLTKGGTRGAIKKYIENGWAKLLAPKGTSVDSEE